MLYTTDSTLRELRLHPPFTCAPTGSSTTATRRELPDQDGWISFGGVVEGQGVHTRPAVTRRDLHYLRCLLLKAFSPSTALPTPQDVRRGPPIEWAPTRSEPRPALPKVFVFKSLSLPQLHYRHETSKCEVGGSACSGYRWCGSRIASARFVVQVSRRAAHLMLASRVTVSAGYLSTVCAAPSACADFRPLHNRCVLTI